MTREEEIEERLLEFDLTEWYRAGPVEVLPGLWLGDYRDAVVLAGDGFVPVCVLEDLPAEEPRSAYWVPILVAAKGGPKAKHEQLDLAAELIDWLLGQRKKVVVHCAAGIERSPLTLAWYLVKKKGMTMDQAYALLKEKRPQVEDRRSWLKRGGHDYFGLGAFWREEKWMSLK